MFPCLIHEPKRSMLQVTSIENSIGFGVVGQALGTD